jgi:TIR domain/FHA domain
MSPASARLVVRVRNGRDHDVKELPIGRVEVGRASGVGLRLTAPDVSSRHAELSWDGSVMLMRDLGSTNGTFLNGRPVADWTPLEEGDQIRWGSVDAEVAASAGQRVPVRRTPAPRGGSRRRIFISHASEDKRWARCVEDDLARRGWDPWLDESDIRGGSSWAASIQAALRSSAVVVLLITANSVAKEWVLDEITAARNLRVPIIAANLDHIRLPDELQFLLQRTQFVDVSGLTAATDDRQKRHAALRSLDDAIRGALERGRSLNPDRALLRIGRVIKAVGNVIAAAGFVGAFLGILGFILGIVGVGRLPLPVPIPIAIPNPLVPFVGAAVAMGVCLVGALLAACGEAMVRSGRAKGL